MTTSWEERAAKAAQKKPLKKLKSLPQMPGITPETARHLRWKSLKYMMKHDKGGKIRRHFLRHPLRYGLRYLASLLKKENYRVDDDFYFYGLESVEAFEELVKQDDTLTVVGFSYCQKPHECPSGRFTPDCVCDPENLVCQQCEIGQVLERLPEEDTIPLLIPTVHYIGEKIFEAVHAHPDKQVLFLITACEMTLKMFADYGHMAGVKGIGVRLDGRICNTMRAFELSEEGIKPGLTVVREPTQRRILDLVEGMRTHASV